MKKHIESSICKGLGIGESLHCFTPFRFIAIWGLGVGELLHCFTPFRFIAIWGLGRGIASLLHSVLLHRDLGVGEGNRFIASLRSASSRFGGWGGELLHCFTPFRFIAIWGRGIASLLHSVPLHRDLGEGRGIASLLHSVPLHRDLGEGRGGDHMKPSPGNQVQSCPIWKPSTSQKETSPLAHFVHNSLPHKSFSFCSPMLEMEPIHEPLDDDRLMVDRPHKQYIV